MGILLLGFPVNEATSKERTQNSYSAHIALSVPSPITPLNAPQSTRTLDSYERYIIMRESGNNVLAANKTSTARGLGQLLISNRKHYAPLCGAVYNTVDYDEQLCMFRAYVKERYGTSARAAEHSRRMGWY